MPWPPCGPTLKPLYQACDLDGLAHLHSLPGQPPFVRGPYASMYTHKPWTIRQYTGFADARETNQRLKEHLANGAQGLSIAFDLPTQRGYDSDDPRCSADVGMAGVAIDSVEDMHALFDGIALDQVSVSMTMNAAVLPVMAAFIVAAQESGTDPARLSGTLQNDILKEFMVRNTYVFAPQASLRICTDVIHYLAKHLPRFNPISVSGYHFQEAGADPVLELALTLMNARTYLEQVRDSGLDVNRFCARMSFFFGIGNNLFSEVAKLRAARLLWCEISETCGVTQASARALRTHCQTSGYSLSAHDPMNNVVRTTIQALAAVFGGTQSLHTNAWDEALALPSADSARLASNTQRILQQETGICDVIDPWAGSYMMESLTASVCDQVRDCIARIDAEGGVVAAIHSGSISALIHAQALASQARLDRGEHIRVGERSGGPNMAATPPTQSIDGRSVREQQCQRLRRLRLKRDEPTVRARLHALEQGVLNARQNLLALCVEAMAARATVGECMAALERVWPRYRQTPTFTTGLYADLRTACQGWQALRQRVEDFSIRHGRAPHVLLSKLGQDGHDRGIRLISSVLADAGFSVTLLPLFQGPTQLLARLDEDPSIDLLGISSLAGAHAPLLGVLLEQLASRPNRQPVVVGGIVPEADIAALLALGVETVFGPGSDMLDIAATLLELIERYRFGTLAA
ncbi:methylmalonyl-CoA mutase [Pseudomonas sp. X10]